MKDRLKAWKQAHPELDESPEARAKRQAEERRAQVLAEQQERDRKAKDRASAREEALSDADLFKRAVGDMPDRSGAILKKYDERDTPRTATRAESAEGKRLNDAQLFLDAVRDVPPPEDDGVRAKGARAPQSTPAKKSR
jgi:hypothetical protein